VTREEAIEQFERGVRTGRAGHGYLVVGPEGPAVEFVKQAVSLMFCGTKAGKKPCGECRDCRWVEALRHPDLHWVEPEKKSRIIPVERIRALQQELSTTSFASKWKACVLVAADRLGISAANAFLKTLEEPAGDTVFFLVTDSPHSLLPTIVSRCRKVILSESGAESSEERHDALAGLLASGCRGSTVAALAAADGIEEILKKARREAEEEEKAAQERAGVEEMDKETFEARVQARYRQKRTAILRFMLLWHRDALLIVCGAGEGVLANRSAIAGLKERASRLSYRQALENIQTIEKLAANLERNIPEPAAFADAFLSLH